MALAVDDLREILKKLKLIRRTLEFDQMEKAAARQNMAMCTGLALVAFGGIVFKMRPSARR